MLESEIRRLLDAYPAIFLACHRRHLRADETGRTVTERQASVLDHLDAKRPTTLSKLAEHMGVGRSAMSVLVSRLVRGGYVVRSVAGDDGRCVALTLTPAGAGVRKEHAVLDPALLRAMLRRVPRAELEQALRGLECLAHHARVLLRERKRGRDG
jgi:MarR family transcriptional regulator, organic hydroperoxide resistance regulator